MRAVAVALFGILFSLSLASSVAANPYYYGQWQADNCQLFLKRDLSADARSCVGEWAFVKSWRPTAGGVDVLHFSGRAIAQLALSGDQLIMTGATGHRVVFHRVGNRPTGAASPHAVAPPTALTRPPGAAPQVGATSPFTTPRLFTDPLFGGAPPQPRRPAITFQDDPTLLVVGAPNSFALAEMAQRGTCVFRGDSRDCASKRDLGVPISIPTNAKVDGRSAWVTLLRNQWLYAKIGYSEQRLTIAPKALCIRIYACHETSTGLPWCYTGINGKTGYLPKFGRADDKSLKVNFSNGCEPGATVAGQANP